MLIRGTAADWPTRRTSTSRGGRTNLIDGLRSCWPRRASAATQLRTARYADDSALVSTTVPPAVTARTGWAALARVTSDRRRAGLGWRHGTVETCARGEPQPDAFCPVRIDQVTPDVVTTQRTLRHRLQR